MANRKVTAFWETDQRVPARQSGMRMLIIDEIHSWSRHAKPRWSNSVKPGDWPLLTEASGTAAMKKAAAKVGVEQVVLPARGCLNPGSGSATERAVFSVWKRLESRQSSARASVAAIRP